jgi:hypothetical protein
VTVVSIEAAFPAAGRTVRPYRGAIAVLAGPFPLALLGGSRPLTTGRLTVIPVTRGRLTPRPTAHRLAIA